MHQKKHLIFLFAVLGFLAIRAQQTPSFTEYNYNPVLLNSAYSGVLSDLEVSLSNFGFGPTDFEGTPKRFSLSLNAPLRNNKMGLGLGVINDEIGVTNATQVFGTYSYRITLNDNAHPYWKIYDRSFISFGLRAGVLLYNQDLLSLGIQNDPNFAENINSTLPTIGAGILFGHGNFFAGVSSPNLLGDQIANPDDLELSSPLYAYTGYHLMLSRYEAGFILKPSFLFKYENGAPFQMDTNLAVSYKNIFELGAGYRTSSTINAFAGIYLLKNLRIIYSYSQGSGDSPLGNTHGIVLSYRGGKGYSMN